MVTKAIAKKFHRKKSFTIPMAAVAGFAPLALNTMRTAGGWDRKLWMLTQAMTGYDTDAGKFWYPNMAKGLFPIIGGFLVHYLVGQKFGVNRMLSRAGIPLIRI